VLIFVAINYEQSLSAALETTVEQWRGLGM